MAVTGWSILRQVRDTVMNGFGLDESDFDPGAPCLLEGPKTINIGGQDRSLDALDADIVPRTGDGRLVVDGTVSAENKLYDFKATFTVTYEMGLDDIPRTRTRRRSVSRPTGTDGAGCGCKAIPKRCTGFRDAAWRIRRRPRWRRPWRQRLVRRRAAGPLGRRPTGRRRGA
ncbi:hypothetical protein AWC19_22925 [Mycobacterium palustre]|uniref:Uncharacterized protein n=1 Tax=Mycobacterium palustre TaxID=153971 RepID=A0A1X1YY23_9MYCO|nr:hypothetical protein AWC19_22925 [Mycobacterium palustre]